ncbi:MAG TPA: hypothetical protein VGB19_00300 [Actinomycetota bacterium]
MRRRTALVMAALVAVGLALSPTPAGAASTAFRAPAAGAERIGGARAVQVSTKGPSWYDLAFYHRVIAAGTNGVRAPRGAQMPLAVGLAYPGIRPGLWLVTVTTNPVGFAWCTANFVFAKRGVSGLGTAGHCAAKDALGAYPDVTAYVVPPPTSGQLPGFYHIGKFVLSHNNGIGDDFAMISIYSKYSSWVNPTMPVWGGPTGVYTSTLPTVAKHFGHGAAVGAGGTPRAGVCPILNARSGNAFAWYGVGAPGDSGSGVEAAAGEALGNFTHIVIYDGTNKNPAGQILPGMLTGTKMTKILSIASGWTLKLGSLIPI